MINRYFRIISQINRLQNYNKKLKVESFLCVEIKKYAIFAFFCIFYARALAYIKNYL